MTASEKVIQDVLLSASDYFDLTEAAHQHKLLKLANTLYCLKDISIERYQEIAAQPNCPLEFRLAVKLVESRRYLLSVTKPLTVGVVFAMWGEHNRLNEKSVSNPNGEDSLRVKIEQLNWVTQGTVVDWQLYPVDDGCPHNSFAIAQNIAKSSVNASQVTVLNLAQVLPTQEGPLKGLASADDSRKGGAIIYGCQTALKDGVDCVMYTDADNSVHLGQLGLLLKPYLADKQQVVLGNRKHPDSILVKQEERWGVGIKTLRHMQRMIGKDIFSKGIKDTQAAFKLYGKDVLKQIIAKPTVYDFSFDTDWILAAMEMKQPIATVPFAFIDSAAESASVVQGPMTTWYTLLDGLVKAVRARHADYNIEMADIFDQQVGSHEDLEAIINDLPPELVDATDADLGDPQLMSPKAVRAWLVEMKQPQEVTQ
ncbi:glycosyltransferase [Photobacterium jeanii]|uniref:Glycosyltransferase n=2 Tax=Photobacterium jeanii TaxID=858640 RepID=A0A178KA15_9GAMM|nr:glycosyltransferase [Photobacterium jeanii]OAN13805.1 glycosyltransferase [Photobacterium jeanii]PST92733.1 glycosyltransferase [Photobacterium jeanii]